MIKYTQTTDRKGNPITLSTDDTFTLAIGRFDEDYHESTSQELRELFTIKELHRLIGNTNDLNEESKLRKALAR